MTTTIRVGTASWTDPGFVADWYPPRLPVAARLNWYAQHFNLVELNSSFYGIPNHRSVERWCEQTPEGFVFNVKLHKLLSRHTVRANLLLPGLRAMAQLKGDTVVLTPELEEALTLRFLNEIRPFADVGKMGALLLQLSPSFSPGKHRLDELDRLFDLLEGWKVAVELRNRNWVVGEERPGTEEYFKRRRLSFVMVDAPASEHFTVMPRLNLATHSALAYFRLHGRDEKAYRTGRTVAERFNYQYPDNELDEVLERTKEAARSARELHVVFNNNCSDYAPRAAAKFLAKVLEQLPGSSAPMQPGGSRQLRLLE
jgi:uncharacterized protein YecE (DUF72 family)